jgi:glucan endo-1,3-alpha-glucosidase
MTGTFSGGSLTFGAPTPTLGWQAQYHDALGALGIKTYFVPTFLDTSVAPSDFFNAYPSVDGQFNWNSWSWISEGKVQVSDVADQQYHDAAIAAGKTFMMGISPLQFKHLDGGNNWYRRGELTLAERVPQILSLQPDFVQIQTWNDGGESSYIGNVWDNAIVGSPAHGYIDGFDHSGWQILMKAFIAAYKSGGRTAADVVPVSGNGKNAEGVFWYHPILSTASCSADPLGRPAGAENAEDAVQVAVMLAGPAVGATVNVYSGGALIGSYKGVKGLNSWSVDGLNVGEQKVEVIGTDGSVLLSAVGQQAVQPDATVCNFNHAVVGLR